MSVRLGLVLLSWSFQQCNATVLKGSSLLSDYSLSSGRVGLPASRKRNGRSYSALTLHVPHLGSGLGKQLESVVNSLGVISLGSPSATSFSRRGPRRVKHFNKNKTEAEETMGVSTERFPITETRVRALSAPT